jgi:hypothetical protein
MAKKILQVELPEEDVNFMESYARKQGKSVAEFIEQYIQQLQTRNAGSLHPEVTRMTGILPKDLNVKSEYYEYIREKHQ